MNDPLTYRNPGTIDPANARRRRAARTVQVGVTVFALSIALLLSPWYLGHGMPTACLAGFGFLGDCLGLSIMLHGAWDWLRAGKVRTAESARMAPDEPK